MTTNLTELEAPIEKVDAPKAGVNGHIILLVTLLFSLLNFFGYYYAYRLLVAGVHGEYTMLVESFDGLALYIASLIPGLFFLTSVTIVSVVGLPRIIENLFKTQC